MKWLWFLWFVLCGTAMGITYLFFLAIDKFHEWRNHDR
jgi:hypothetical protein